MPPSDPDALTTLLGLSVAEREDAVTRLCESLAADADGLRRLKRLRSLMDRTLRDQTRRATPGRASRWGQPGGRGLSG